MARPCSSAARTSAAPRWIRTGRADDLGRKPMPPIQGCGAGHALLLLQPSDPTGCLLNVSLPCQAAADTVLSVW
jgi:hypothetical protein